MSSVKTRHVSWSPLSRYASEQGVCEQKVARASPDRWGHGTPTGPRGNAFVLVSHSHDKTSRLCVETKRCWTLAEDIILEWEQRKKRRVGGGAPRESRKPCKTVTCHAVGVAEPVQHQAPLRGRWRTWRRWRRNGRRAGPWEVRFANLARQSFTHFVSHYVMTPLMIRHHCGCTSSAKSRTLQARAEGLFVLCECDNFLLVPCC